MSSMDVDIDVPSLLRDARIASPASLQGSILQMEELWERRLWHQLTLELEKFFGDQQSNGLRMRMFKDFVGTFEKNINQLKLVGLALLAKKECKDTNEALEFMTNIVERVNTPGTQDAYVYALVETASLKLLLGEGDAVRKDLDGANKILDTFDSIDTIIHAAFYRVNADYFSSKIDYGNYYRNALLYLACLPEPSPLSKEESQTRAYHLSIAALLAEKIYNFGELLQHPILNELQDTDSAWLRDLLFAMNSGNLDAFSEFSLQLQTIPLLASHAATLQQKIHLSALLSLIFSRPPHSRTLPFELIAQETRLPINEVEYLVMKALSLGLIRGTIDQVDRIVKVTWMQGRVLDKKGVQDMKERLESWSQGVRALEGWVYRAGRDVWVK